MLGFELCNYFVTRQEMMILRKSWWLSWDSGHLNGLGSVDCGCIGRLVVLGRGIEVFKPMKQKTNPSQLVKEARRTN